MTKSTYAMRLGAVLRARRKLLGLTQAEVAELAGTSQRSISQVEAGNAATLELYGATAEVLGLELTAAAPLPRGEAP